MISHVDKVSKYFGEIGIIFTFVCTMLSYFIGGWDKAIMALVVLASIDIATGSIKGFFFEKDFTSKRLREGFGTKVMYILVIGVGNIMDSVFFVETPLLRTLAIFFYIYVEGMSILENLGSMGAPIPQRLIDGLGQVERRVGGFAKMKDGKFEKSEEITNESEDGNDNDVG